MLTPNIVQSSLKFHRAGLFLVVKDLTLTGIVFQVMGVKINLLLHELVLLGLELEELFTGPPEELPAAAEAVRVMPTRWAYTCGAASNQAIWKAPWW